MAQVVHCIVPDSGMRADLSAAGAADNSDSSPDVEGCCAMAYSPASSLLFCPAC